MDRVFMKARLYMLTDEEKIQRAKEIYYRRNGISFRGEEKKKKHNKSFIFIIVISLVAVYLYQNQSIYFTTENKEKIKEFLNTKINLNEFIKVPEKNENTTYVTLVGVEKAKEYVEEISEEAIGLLSELPQRNEFLEALLKELIHREK